MYVLTVSMFLAVDMEGAFSIDQQANVYGLFLACVPPMLQLLPLYRIELLNLSSAFTHTCTLTHAHIQLHNHAYSLEPYMHACS